MYINVNLPASPGQIISDPTGFKTWEYHESTSTRPNAVGRFIVKFQISGGGPSPTDTEYVFRNGKAIQANRTGPIVIGGKPVYEVDHNINFNSLIRLETLPEIP